MTLMPPRRLLTSDGAGVARAGLSHHRRAAGGVKRCLCVETVRPDEISALRQSLPPID